MSVFIPIPKKGNAKECSNYHTIALISHASKVTLKILQARLQQYMKHQLPDVQAGFRKGRGTRDQIANICWIIEKAREFQKNIYWSTCWETCMQVKKQQLELDMENILVPSRKRSRSRLYIVTLLIYLICRVHHEKRWARWSTSWNQDCQETYNPAIPLLGIHTRETRIERDTCTPVFITALFTIARTWKQPRCPLADEWIRKLWYIFTVEYYSAI